ncbi:serine/threonine-protein kinase [Spirillospora sp. CA-294931]|uniref:serine/threonine-protein kinase n=1 Tax=Spirillospora sp. CA-294931 TaxID=3240042 RepID=UPI003D8FFBA3
MVNAVNGWTVPGFTHVGELGTGSGGRVVLAVDDLTQTKVAIKYLDGRLGRDSGFLDRYRAVARLMSQLEDPNIVDLYEFVETPEGTAAVMERVDGVSLRRVLAAQGPTGPLAALSMLGGTLVGLAAAHAAGVVHGGLRPSEILIDTEGNSRITDFGLAPPGGEAQAGPAYGAPELWDGAPASIASDLYAATIIFYECLTGRPPFTARSQSGVARAHRENPIPAEEVPGPLRELITQGLAKDPRERPASAAEFLRLVEEAAVGAYGPAWEAQGRSRLTELAAHAADRPEPAPAGRRVSGPYAVVTGQTGGGRPLTRILVAALAVVLVIGGVVGAALVMGEDKDKEKAPPTSPANRGSLRPTAPVDPRAAALAGRIGQATSRAPSASFTYRRTGCCGVTTGARGSFALARSGPPSYTMTVSGSGDARRPARAVVLRDVAFVRAGKTWQQSPAQARAKGYPALAAQARWASSMANLNKLLESSTAFRKAKQVYLGSAPIDQLSALPDVGPLYAELATATGARQVSFAVRLDRGLRPVHVWIKVQGQDKARAQVLQSTYSGWGRRVAITAPR